MDILNQLTPEQRQAIASMPEGLAMKVLGGMMGGPAPQKPAPQQPAYGRDTSPMQAPPVDPNIMPGVGTDPRGQFWQEDSRLSPAPGQTFQPGAEYRTADMSGIKPSGVGEASQLNGFARSFQGLMKSLDDYERLFKDGGSTAWPGKRKDDLATAHRDLQMQMKELYNLGVLNGPDLELMNSILINPTGLGGNILDTLGVADMEKRIPANIENVRRMMINRAEPGLQQIGVKPQDLMPKAKRRRFDPATGQFVEVE